MAERLHTDGLEEQFGTITAVVLRHDGDRRIIDMIDPDGITRTRAITILTPQHHAPHLEHIHDEIRDGGLIGKSFRNHGYSLIKTITFEARAPIPPDLKTKFSTSQDQMQVRAYELSIFGSTQEEETYGIVYELITPEYSDPSILDPLDQSMTHANILIEHLSQTPAAEK